MKKLIAILSIVILLAVGIVPAFSGSNTTHNFFYKPDYGEKGAASYNRYNAALDTTDIFLYSLYGLSDLINNWAIEDQIVTMIPVACTYSDNNTFTLPEDYTSRFAAGAVVQAQVAAGMVYSTVASSSYSAPTTTVNLNDAVLTDPIIRVYVVATRDGLWPNGPGYVVARDYGTDQAALAAADAVAVVAKKELLITYAFPIDADVTLAAPKVTVQPGVPFAIATTKTLTINGTLDAGPYQIFSCTGTGKVVLSKTSAKALYPQWWGAAMNGTTDDRVPFQAAIDCSKSSSIPDVVIVGSLKVTDYVYIDGATNLRGQVGQSEIINDSTAAAAVWVGTDPATWNGYKSIITGIKFSGTATNTTNCHGIHVKAMLAMIRDCVFSGIHGSGIRGEYAQYNQYLYNGFSTCDRYGIEVTTASYDATGSGDLLIEGNYQNIGNTLGGMHLAIMNSVVRKNTFTDLLMGLHLEGINNTEENNTYENSTGATARVMLELKPLIFPTKSLNSSFIGAATNTTPVTIDAASTAYVEFSGNAFNISPPTQYILNNSTYAARLKNNKEANGTITFVTGLYSLGTIDENGLRLMSGAWAPSTFGTSLEMQFRSGSDAAFMTAYDRTNSLYKDLTIGVDSLHIVNGGNDCLTIDGTSNVVTMGHYGAGTATFDASGNISSVSDERLKNIQGKYTAGLKELMGIQPISYKWNKKSGMETKHVYGGFSAQNIQKVMPEAVYENKEGTLSFNDRAILAAAVNAIKELNTKVIKLEAKIKRLEAR